MTETNFGFRLTVVRIEKRDMAAMHRQRLLMWAGGIAIVAASFFVTNFLLDYWSPVEAPDADLIHVAEATFGNSCLAVAATSGTKIQPGNTTAAVIKACDKSRGSCTFAVDRDEIGDPAVGCNKDFKASWRCGSDPTVHQTYLAAPADSKLALLTCPARL